MCGTLLDILVPCNTGNSEHIKIICININENNIIVINDVGNEYNIMSNF